MGPRRRAGPRKGAGKRTGDRSTELEGKNDQVKGEGKQAWGDLKNAGQRAKDAVKDVNRQALTTRVRRPGPPAKAVSPPPRTPESRKD